MAILLYSLDAAVAHAQLLMGKGRRILGLVGKPGSGKSTLAKLVAARLGGKARVSPDGWIPLQQQGAAGTRVALPGRASWIPSTRLATPCS